MSKISDNNKAGLYIHIPFCLSKCAYCSFYSIKSLNLIPEFIVALNKEIKFYGKSFKSFDTVYLGGGTPSLLSIRQLETIFKAINKSYKIDPAAEITIEVNPGDVSSEYFQSLRSLGINRLNIGIQAFDDKLLKFLGRRHSAGEAIAAVNDSRKAGFSNIGIDLIYGIHSQNISLWKKTLQKAISCSPEHISCYQLSLETGTPLHKEYSLQDINLPVEKEQLKFFQATADELEKAGYIHYEVSNFARNENLQSRHNMKYWRHVPYLGVGPAAHSFLDQRRWWNKSSVGNYLKEIAGGKMPVENSEKLTLEQLQLEALFLGLRTKDGINLGLYKQKYGIDLFMDKKTIIEKLLENKLVKLESGFLIPTRAGLAMADSLALI